MMKEVRQIAAVVVTYKRDELLAQCLRCLCLQTAASKMDIIVVDNGGAGRSFLSQIPEVGNIDEIRNFQDKGGKILYRNTGENLGGAGGFSLAMEEAVSREYQLVWVMDAMTHNQNLSPLRPFWQYMKTRKASTDFFPARHFGGTAPSTG